jgi:hypothetical protein
LKRPRGGALLLLLTPDELLARIATLVPPPRTHALRYHGVFAPNSKDRSRVVPGSTRAGPGLVSPGTEHPRPTAPGPHRPGQGPLPEPAGSFRLTPPDPAPEGRPSPRYRVPWAELLRKVFALDVLECPRCAGRLEIIAFIAEAAVARRILDHLGMESQAPPLARARAPGGADAAVDPAPDYDAPDPIHDE